MEKVMPTIAMCIVVLECLERAVGSGNFLWIWLVVGGIWAWATIDFVRQ